MNSPLIPSLLYTQGSGKVNKEIEEELAVPDPEPKTAQAAIKLNLTDKQETEHESST